ncbi:hypothetical protein DFH06DRAFT_613845 [Mycena polygramma]|nr:hypothetical protein DFH06DRAFT_613845 [Mycena polygramma]
MKGQSLRDRLVEIDAQLALLQAERKTIQKQLGALIYPVLSLPFDVISDIFVACLPPVHDFQPIFRFRQKFPAALLLSQICKDWRDIAFKTPRLWAQFSISSTEWPQDHDLGNRQLSQWVERAGLAPLSFILHRCESEWTPSPSPLAMPLPLLRLSAQWGYVDFCLRYTDLATEELQSALSLPSLHTLCIRMEMGVRAEAAIASFQHAPNLRAVVLEQLSPALISLPWAQLRRFTGRWLNPTECMHVLRAAPFLVECTFVTSGRQGIPTNTGPLLPHRHLEILSLTSAAVCLFRTLTLPALTELTLDGEGFGSRYAPEVHTALFDFLVRCRPPLRRLSLCHPDQHFVDCLSFLHTLTMLEMANMADETVPHLLHALTIVPGRSEVVLPNLDSLVLSVFDSHRRKPSVVDYGEVVDTLRSRWRPQEPGDVKPSSGSGARHAQLQCSRMTWKSSVSVGDLLSPPPSFRVNRARLAQLTEEGMCISVLVCHKGSTSPVTQAWI